MKSASTGGQITKDLERMIEIARVDGQQLVVEIQKLINNQPEVLAAIFMHLATVKPESLFEVQPVSAAQKKSVPDLAAMLAENNTPKLLQFARERLARTVMTVRAGEIERLKLEIITAISARLMIMTPDAKFFQEFINIIRTYGTYADCGILDLVGLPEKTDTVGRVKGAVDASVGYLAAKIPRAPSSAVKQQEQEAIKSLLHANLKTVLESVPVQPVTLSDSIEQLMNHKNSDILMKKMFPVNTETQKIEFHKFLKKRFNDQALLPNLRLERNKSLLKLAENIEDCEHVMIRMCAALDDGFDILAKDNLQLYRNIQIVRSVLFEMRRKIADEMFARLNDYAQPVVIEIDSAQAGQTFECPAVEVNLVKIEKGKSDEKLKPATIEIIKESARRSTLGIDTLNAADVCKFINYIAEAGSREQCEFLSQLQPAMLPTANPDQWLSAQIAAWGLDNKANVRQAVLKNRIINARGIVYQIADLAYLRTIIQSVNNFLGNPDQVVKLIADAHEKGFLVKDDFELFWGCVDAIHRQINNPSYSMKLIRGVMNMSENRRQFLQAMSEYIAVNNDSKLKARLTDCLGCIEEDVMRSILFRSFISIKQSNEGERIYEAMLKKFNPKENSAEFNLLVHACANISTRYGSRPGIQYILNCIDEASDVTQLTEVFQRNAPYEETCPLAYYLYSHFPASEVFSILKPLLLDQDTENVTLRNAAILLHPGYVQWMRSVAIELIAADADHRFTSNKSRKDLVITMIAFIQLVNQVSKSVELLNTDIVEADKIAAFNNVLQSLIPMACYLRESRYGDFVQEVMRDCVLVSARKAGVDLEHYLTSIVLLGALHSHATMPDLVRAVNSTMELFQILHALKLPGDKIDVIMSELGSILKKIRTSDAASSEDLMLKYLRMLEFVETDRDKITPDTIKKLMGEMAKLTQGRMTPPARKPGVFSPGYRSPSPAPSNEEYGQRSGGPGAGKPK